MVHDAYRECTPALKRHAHYVACGGSPREESTWRVSGSDVFVLLLLAWLSLRPFLPPIPAYSHISTLILLCAAVSNGWRHGLPQSSIFRWILASTIALSMVALVTHGSVEALYPLVHIGGACAYIMIFRNARIDPRIILAAFVLLVVPEFLLSVFVFGDIHASARAIVGLPIGNAPDILPEEVNQWRVNIGPFGTTVHFTGELGALLLVTCGLMWKRVRRPLYLIGIVIGMYLTVFSGARTAYLAVLVYGFLCLVNRSRIRPLGSTIAVILVIGLSYGAEVISDILPTATGVIGELVHLNNKGDITSARSWLWRYHMSALESAPFMGVGFEPLRFSLGDIVDGKRAKGTSESFYTAMLAAYGLPGLLFPMFHCLLFVAAVRRRQRHLIALAGLVLVSTVANATYGVIYGPFTPFVYAALAEAFAWRRDLPSKRVFAGQPIHA